MDSPRGEIFVADGKATRGRCLIAGYSYLLNDPTSRQAAASIAQRGWDVGLLQLGGDGRIVSLAPPGVRVIDLERRALRHLGPAGRVLMWLRFNYALSRVIAEWQPDLVVVIMLHALAAVPRTLIRKLGVKLIACVYDIPSLLDSGRFDGLIFRLAWRGLRDAQTVWASDEFKADLAARAGELSSTPLVCHNSPPFDPSLDPIYPRRAWLRARLRELGAPVHATGGCVFIRAGAIGPSCGIEDTLWALTNLPDDCVLLLMGRPSSGFRTRLGDLITRLRIEHRAFIWDRPTDAVWHAALQGADVGHLIHTPGGNARSRRMFALNSSLSNYRLFNYMAYGLPIITYDDPRLDQLHASASCFSVVRLGHLKDDLREHMQRLYLDPEQRRRMGESGRALHRRVFNWGVQFAPILEEVNKITARSA